MATTKTEAARSEVAMAEPTTPPDVGQQKREADARRNVAIARILLDEAARLLDAPHPTPSEKEAKE